jgi:8-oxo-dGTP diphosphatase
MSHLTSAVAAVITDPSGRVLLCQQSQGHRLWGLPGGTIRHEESPVRAAVRDIREETGMETDILDLVGIYQLTGDGCGSDLPDVLMHVFRARVEAGDATVNSGKICRLSWQDPAALPQPMTATTRIALADAIAGRSGVLREVVRDVDPAISEAGTATAPAPASSGDLALVHP